MGDMGRDGRCCSGHGSLTVSEWDAMGSLRELMCKFRKEVRGQNGELVWGPTHTATMTEIIGRDLIKGDRN